METMTHIIILLHFLCITVGSILFYELLRKERKNRKKRNLIIGIAITNFSFLLDTLNIYCRHWYQGYPFNDVVEVCCTLLFAASLVFLIIYAVRLDGKLNQDYKRTTVIIAGIYLFCILLQILGNKWDSLLYLPWNCFGYIAFCGVQFTIVFQKHKEENHGNGINDDSQDGFRGNSEEMESEESKKEECQNALDILTPREREIACYISEGKSYKEIAELLFISQNTVRNHVNHIYKKLEVKNKVELTNRLK